MTSNSQQGSVLYRRDGTLRASLTAGQVARLLDVSTHVAANLGDSGVLPCYRLPLLDRKMDRRFHTEGVLRYLRDNGVHDGISSVQRACGMSALLISPDAALAQDVCQVIQQKAVVEIDIASDPFLAGRHSAGYRHGVIVVCNLLGRQERLHLAGHLLHERTRLIALAGEDEADVSYLTDAGYTAVLHRPLAADALAAQILIALGVRPIPTVARRSRTA